MHTHYFLLMCLLFLNENIGLKVHHVNGNCKLFNSGTCIETNNRVIHTNVPTAAEIDLIKEQFNGLPFTWPIRTNDEDSSHILKEHGFTELPIYPTMIIDLADLQDMRVNDCIEVKEIDEQSDEIDAWASTLVKAFPYFGNITEIIKMVQVLKEQINSSYSLRLAYYNGVPAAGGFVLIHGDVASLHWIGCIREFRQRGLGYAVTHSLLLHAKNKGCKQAILIASALGRPVYERLGFKEFDRYKFYRYVSNN